MSRGVENDGDVKCTFSHPKRCRKFTKFGTHFRLGCDKGDHTIHNTVHHLFYQNRVLIKHVP